MPSFSTTTVTGITAQRSGLQRVTLATGRRAYVLTDLVGDVAVGDRVVVNTTAVDLDLGTGGWDVVHWNLERDGWSQPGPGHIMKLRYTSLQSDTGAAEEALPPGSAEPQLEGLPVIACSLHSQMALAALAFKHERPTANVVFVMTDSASLPLVLSDLVATLVDHRVLHATVSTGQAFGGTCEAVNLASGLRVAARGGADLVIVAPGPGVVGTASALGHGGIELGTIVDAVAIDGGRPFAALRYSDADQRERHRGVSHHSRTGLARAHHPAIIPVPRGANLTPMGHHALVEVDVPETDDLLAGTGIEVTTMGRRPADDPGFFRFAAAAGVGAARL